MVTSMDTRTLYVILYALAAALPLAGLVLAVLKVQTELTSMRKKGGLSLGDLSDHFGPNPSHIIRERGWSTVALVLVGLGLISGAWASIGSLFL